LHFDQSLSPASAAIRQTGFVIHSSVGVKTFQEMLDHAKKNPGNLAFCSSGPGTAGHLRLEMLRYNTGVDILHVSYRGGADALIDILANTIQMMNEPVTLPHVNAASSTCSTSTTSSVALTFRISRR
jgi:tripartite-type tricarboxylate transporter receptor subunit TctC